MRRRLVKHGPSTLIVSLPAKWIKERKLQPGDEVNIDEQDTGLVLSSDKQHHEEEVEFDITNLDRTSVVLLLHSIYRSGVTRCTLTFSTVSTIHYRTGKKIRYAEIIHSLMGRFIGYEITREKAHQIEITQVSHIDKEQIPNMIQRTFHLLYDITQTFNDAFVDDQIEQFASIETQHDTITKLISFLIRSITVKGLENKRYSNTMIHILATIDKLIDTLKYIARRETKTKSAYSEPFKELVRLFSSSVMEYVKLFQKYDEKKVNMISKKRDEYKIQLKEVHKKLSASEFAIGTELAQALELLFDLLEWRFVLVLSQSSR